jgi:hypothetical protein
MLVINNWKKRKREREIENKIRIQIFVVSLHKGSLLFAGIQVFLEDRKLLWYQQMGSTCHDMRSCPPPPCHVTLSPGFKLARCFHEKPSYG